MTRRFELSIVLGVIWVLTGSAVSGAFAQETPATGTQAATDEASRADRARYLFKYAVAAIKKGDQEVGEEKLAEAASLVPDNALIWYNLAAVQAKNHKYYPAVDSVGKALSLGLTGADREAAEDLQIELSYTLSKAPKEPRLLATSLFFAVDQPKGPTVRAPQVEAMGNHLVRGLMRALTPDSQIIVRGEPGYPAGNVSTVPACPSAAAPAKLNPQQYLGIRQQWHQCIESQLRLRAEQIRDELRKNGFDGFAVLAMEGSQSRRTPENFAVSGVLYLVSKEGQVTKVENIEASALIADSLSNLLVDKNGAAVQTAARRIRLLETR